MYTVEFHFFGLNSFYYHLVNVLLHACNAFGVFLLCRNLLKNDFKSFWAALIFAVHPLQWEVCLINNRSMLLYSFFVLWCVFFYQNFLQKERVGYYLASLVMFLGALFTKESAVFLPCLLVVQTWAAGKLPKGKKLAPFFIGVLFYALIRQNILGPTIGFWNSGYSMILGVASFLWVVATIVRLIFYPFDLYLDRSSPLFSTLFCPQIIAGFIFCLSLIVMLWRQKDKMTRTHLFFMAWMIIELLPVSQIVPLNIQNNMLYANEHLAYLFLIGVLVLMVEVLAWGYAQAQKDSRKVFQCLAVILVVSFVTLARQQNILAYDQKQLYRASLSRAPDNKRVRVSLALALASEGFLQEAKKELQKVLTFDPHDDIARLNIGRILYLQKKYLEALEEYEKINTSSKRLTANKEEVFRALIDGYRIALEKDPQDPKVYYSLGIIFSKKGDISASIAAYQEAVRYDPGMKEALYNLGVSYAQIGQWPQALEWLKKSLQIPGDPQFDRVIAQYLKDVRQKPKAPKE